MKHWQNLIPAMFVVLLEITIRRMNNSIILFFTGYIFLFIH